MAETTVITSEGDDEGSEVLAQAAVASAAVSGAAAATAQDAKDTAQDADWKAEDAQRTGEVALSVAADKVDETRAREIAREEMAALLAEAMEQREAPKVEAEVEIAPEVLPPSVAKANDEDPNGGRKDNRGKWARSWETGS